MKEFKNFNAVEFLRMWELASLRQTPEDAETLAKIPNDKARSELARAIFKGEAGYSARKGKREKIKLVE